MAHHSLLPEPVFFNGSESLIARHALLLSRFEAAKMSPEAVFARQPVSAKHLA